MSCPERQQLLNRFSAAFEDFSAVVRQLKSSGAPRLDPTELTERSAEAQNACKQLWAELQEHQAKHKCWR